MKSVSCLNCGRPMRRSDLDGGELHACDGCGSIWCSARQYARSEVGLSVELKEQENGRRRCPECLSAMKSLTVAEDPAVVIDQCSACYGFWFDPDEWELMRRMSERHTGDRDRARASNDRADRWEFPVQMRWILDKMADY